MKQRLVALLCLITAVGAFGQGTVDFRNRNTTVTPTLDAPVFDVDGVTRVSGAAFVAQLYFSATQTGSYTPVTGANAPFRAAGPGAGYWDYGTDFARTLTGVVAGTAAWVTIRVWEAAAGSYTAAQGGGFKWGESTPIQITTGGAGNPPSVPGALVGLTSFSLVPEPSTYALMALGACALAFRRRNK